MKNKLCYLSKTYYCFGVQFRYNINEIKKPLINVIAPKLDLIINTLNSLYLRFKGV